MKFVASWHMRRDNHGIADEPARQWGKAGIDTHDRAPSIIWIACKSGILRPCPSDTGTAQTAFRPPSPEKKREVRHWNQGDLRKWFRDPVLRHEKPGPRERAGFLKGSVGSKEVWLRGQDLNL